MPRTVARNASTSAGVACVLFAMLAPELTEVVRLVREEASVTGAALGLSLETPRDFPVLNASINRFTVHAGKLSLVSWGEVGHLQPKVLDELS